MTINPLNYSINDLNKVNLEQGRLLLAEPFMDDTNFKRSVILLSVYNSEEAFGFILNKPLEVRLHEVLKDFPDFDAPIYLGGPVQTDTLFFVHSQGDLIEESMPIGNNFFWSGNFENLKTAIINQNIFPHEIKFFVGYSGWGYDQLQQEIKQESWIIAKNQFQTIAETNSDQLWHSCLKNMGKKYALLSNFPEDPNLN